MNTAEDNQRGLSMALLESLGVPDIENVISANISISAGERIIIDVTRLVVNTENGHRVLKRISESTVIVSVTNKLDQEEIK